MVHSSPPNSPTASDWKRLFRQPKDVGSKATASDFARVFKATIHKGKNVRTVSYTPDAEDA